MIRKTFVINGVQRTMMVNENETLATFLRERLLLTGCKIGCGEGHCGACNVIVDGKVARSCLMKLSKRSRTALRSPPSKASVPSPICIPCRSPGWLTAVRSVASAPPASL